MCIARPTGFEHVTLGLEMQGIVYTNDLVLHRFVILQRVYENGLKTHSPKLRNLNEKEINKPRTKIPIAFFMSLNSTPKLLLSLRVYKD